MTDAVNSVTVLARLLFAGTVDGLKQLRRHPHAVDYPERPR